MKEFFENIQRNLENSSNNSMKFLVILHFSFKVA